MSEYKPRVYVKGDDTKIAQSPSAATALEFDGYVVQEDQSADEVAAPAAQPKADEPVRDTAPKPRPPVRQPQED